MIKRRRLLVLLFIPFLLIALGTAGYMLLEDWRFIEALYMTAIALTTVGFGEVRPLSDTGRAFTIALILLGAGSLAYALSTVGEILITSGLPERLRKRRMMSIAEKMKGHVIVCGYGRVGRSALESLRESKRDVVVIEKDAERAAQAIEHGFVVIEGDAGRDEILQEAGIAQAYGLVVSTGDDSLNLFIVLSARALSEELYIVARSVDAENERKMRRAGANRVVSPYQIGGKHMANIVIRPHVTDFFDVVTLNEGIELWLEELVIEPYSRLAGKTVGGANVRRHTGVQVVAVQRQEGGVTITPNAQTRLEEGDHLIVLGTREQLSALEKMVKRRDGR